MKQFDVMQTLYDSEITVRVEPNGCWDNGFRAQIGDDQNGWQEPTFYSGNWNQLMTNLALHVEHKHPEGKFAARLQAAREWDEAARRSARQLNGGFEVVIWDDVDIPMHSCSTIVPRGLYVVTLLFDEAGKTDGAQLTRRDAEGQPPIRLKQDQFEMLDGTPYFERRCF